MFIIVKYFMIRMLCKLWSKINYNYKKTLEKKYKASFLTFRLCKILKTEHFL